MPKTKKALLLLSFFILVFLLLKNGLPLNQRVNLLLLGTPGGRHEGSQLTDTIIFTSVHPRKNEIVLISIPRDLYIKERAGKINAVYTEGGLELAKSTVAKVLGQPIDYAVRIDFQGFTRAVDLVGGLTIEIENTFADQGYPIEGRENDLCGVKEEDAQKLATSSSKLWEVFPCRFEYVHFERGVRHMDGETTLKFVRSRNAEGVEGTDFARGRRQQKVIVALKNALLTPSTILNPLKVIALYNIAATHIETDIALSKFDNIARLVQKMRNPKVRSVVLDYGDRQRGTAGLLVNPNIESYGAWVLIPRKGEDNFSEVKQYVACIIESENCNVE